MSADEARSALLTVEMERRLAGLSFPMRHAMRSRVLGQHRSRQAGSSIEFSEHKEYHPGDDLRRVNWKAYGRLDRFYIKQYVQEASAAAMILLDTSGSMYVSDADGTPKVRYAAGLAGALAYVLLHQGDKVGMIHAPDGGVERIEPHRHPAHYHRLRIPSAPCPAPVSSRTVRPAECPARSGRPSASRISSVGMT